MLVFRRGTPAAMRPRDQAARVQPGAQLLGRQSTSCDLSISTEHCKSSAEFHLMEMTTHVCTDLGICGTLGDIRSDGGSALRGRTDHSVAGLPSTNSARCVAEGTDDCPQQSQRTADGWIARRCPPSGPNYRCQNGIPRLSEADYRSRRFPSGIAHEGLRLTDGWQPFPVRKVTHRAREPRNWFEPEITPTVAGFGRPSWDRPACQTNHTAASSDR